MAPVDIYGDRPDARLSRHHAISQQHEHTVRLAIKFDTLKSLIFVLIRALYIKWGTPKCALNFSGWFQHSRE